MFITTFITNKQNFDICVGTIRQYINGICTYYLQQGIEIWIEFLNIICEAHKPLESVPKFRKQYFKPHKYEWIFFKLKKKY